MGKAWSGSYDGSGSCLGFVASDGKVWSGSYDGGGSCVGFANAPMQRTGAAILLLFR